MEISKTINKYDHVLFNIPLEFHNITIHKQIDQPRKRIVQECSCEVFFYNVKILSLPRHWRHGEELSELKWLSGQGLLSKEHWTALEKFISYMHAPVEFYNENDFFAKNMEDPWCFEHAKIGYCLNDFIDVYNLFQAENEEINVLDFFPIIGLMEPEWINNFHSEVNMDKFIEVSIEEPKLKKTINRSRR